MTDDCQSRNDAKEVKTAERISADNEIYKSTVIVRPLSQYVPGNADAMSTEERPI
jgi:hypothetical protein